MNFINSPVFYRKYGKTQSFVFDAVSRARHFAQSFGNPAAERFVYVRRKRNMQQLLRFAQQHIAAGYEVGRVFDFYQRQMSAAGRIRIGYTENFAGDVALCDDAVGTRIFVDDDRKGLTVRTENVFTVSLYASKSFM